MHQVPLPQTSTTTVARTETGKSEDPKYHDSSEVIPNSVKFPLPMTRMATKRVPLPSSHEDFVDVKFRVVTLNMYEKFV